MSEWIVTEGIDLDKDEINVSIKYSDYGGQQYVTVKKVDMEKLLGADKLKEDKVLLLKGMEQLEDTVKDFEKLEAENKRLKNIINTAHDYIQTSQVHSNPNLIAKNIWLALDILKDTK